MASLIENIIDVLEQENEKYEALIVLSREKTPIIIQGDLPGLSAITEKEQAIVAQIQALEKQRIQITKDIANVTNQKEEDIKVENLIAMMQTRPVEHGKLTAVHDKLRQTLGTMSKVNEQNRELLKNSLEMIDFEMNLLQSMRQAPETADYNRGAYNTGAIMGSGTKRFDAKQ